MQSPKTLALLGVPEGGEVPESIARLDPEIVEAVCSEVVEGRATVTWEDIAGQEHAKVSEKGRRWDSMRGWGG